MQSTKLKAEITRLTEMLRQANLEAGSLAAEERIQAVLIEEIHHRTQNMLAMVTAIVRQSIRTATSLEDAESAIGLRLMAMSKAHALLLRTDLESAGLHDVVRDAIAQHDTMEGHIQLDGSNMPINPAVILPLALALNELCTNATKYGALSKATGQVGIAWNASETDFTLRWTESGGPPVAKPSRSSFGMRLIEQALPRQLGGTGRVSFPPSGMTFDLILPLDRIVPAPLSKTETASHV